MASLVGAAPRATGLTGWRLAACRAAWAVTAVASSVVAIASFASLLTAPSLAALLRGGLFALQPDLPNALALLGLDTPTLLRMDLAVRLAGVAVFWVTAMVLVLRRSDDWMATLASATLLLCGTAWFAPSVALPSDGAIRAVAEAVGTSLPFGPTFGRSLAAVALMLLAYLFPDGRFVPLWTRWATLAVAVHALAWTAAPGTTADASMWPPPIALSVSLAVGASALVAQVYRFVEVSSPEQRQQTRLVVGALVVAYATLALLTTLRPQVGAGLGDLSVVTPEVEAVYDLILLTMLGAALLALPASIAVSVLRYRLWDIDTLLSRTLAYALVTGILLAAYFGVVGAAGLVVAGRSWVVAAAATLSVAVAFQPLRQRVQDLVDRRFLRQRYDTVRTLGAFSRILHDEVDLDTLAGRALEVVGATLAPAGASLWVGVPGGEAGRPAMRRVAFQVPDDTVVGPSDFDRVELGATGLSALREAGGPLDLGGSTPPDLVAFRDVGVSLTIPLLAQGELVGLLNLGPRRSERGYSRQDRVLLAQLADHVAAAVRVALLVRSRDTDLRARQRIEEEMRVARAIQQQFLPRQLPVVDGWSFRASYQPAREVGGDFYDFIDLPDGRLCVVAGDVTGKGVPAALVMASTQSILRGEIPRRASPGEVLARANERLVAEIPPGMFVTCLCAFIDLATGEISLANAGHNLPVVHSADGLAEPRATGMPLGLLPEQHYPEFRGQLPAGSFTLLHSDGLAEARDGDGELFGFHRVRAAVERCRSAEELVPRLLEDLRGFTPPEWEQDDDITLVVLDRHADGQAPLRPARGVRMTASPRAGTPVPSA